MFTLKGLRLQAYTAHYTAWKKFICTPVHAANVLVSALFLEASYRIAQIAGIYATQHASRPVTDLVFEIVPKIDTSFIHGPLSFFLFDCRYILFIIFIRYAPFGAKALAAIILVRAITICLTHLGMPEGIVPIESWLTFGGDLFFSGHVANTFMLSLIFWNKRWLRYLFIIASIIFGIGAVIGHYHYTIDVIAAPFFTYGIFVLCTKLFKRDYELISTVHKKA